MSHYETCSVCGEDFEPLSICESCRKPRKPRWDRSVSDSRLNWWLRYLAWKPNSSITLEILPR